MGASFVVPQGGDPFAILALALGAGMTTTSGLLPQVKKVSAGPHGFGVETRDPSEITMGLAEEGPAAFVGEIAQDNGFTVFQNESEVLDVARWWVAEAAVAKLLRPEAGALAGCDLHLYLYDADEAKLLPIFEDDGSPSEGWEPGRGATGAAYARGEFVIVTGDHTHDATYGLTHEQQARCSGLTAVAAMPVFNASERLIAVLSASTESANHQLDTPEAFEELLVLAVQVSRVLVDLLHWEDD